MSALAMERVATTVLLADPDAGARSALMWFLLSEGFWVEPVATGLDAAIALENRLPTVAIIDLGLPGFNARRLMDFMRGSDRLRDVPIIATAATEPLAALPKGVPFLRKPCDFDEVLAIVNENRTGLGDKRFTSRAHPFPAAPLPPREARRSGSKY